MSEKIKVQHATHIFDVSGQTHGEVNHDIDKMEVWDERKKKLKQVERSIEHEKIMMLF